MNSSPIEVSFKHIDKMVTITVEPNETVLHLKSLYSQKTGIEIENLKFIFGGQILENNCLFTTAEIKDKSLIHVICSFSGKPGLIYLRDTNDYYHKILISSSEPVE